jgi:hypothetical protein
MAPSVKAIRNSSSCGLTERLRRGEAVTKSVEKDLQRLNSSAPIGGPTWIAIAMRGTLTAHFILLPQVVSFRETSLTVQIPSRDDLVQENSVLYIKSSITLTDDNVDVSVPVQIAKGHS